MPLDLLDRIVLTGSVLTGEVGDELVALDIDRGLCFGLNSVGSQVWRRIAEPISVGDLCGALCELYDVEHEVCEAQVVALLESLLAEGLARVV